MKIPNAPEILWQIGNPLAKDLDFHKHAFSQLDSHPIFVVGESDPHTDWPFVHPGPLNASTNFRELSASVRFNLSTKSETISYVLELEAREVSGPCPDLCITINGEAGYFFPAPIRQNRSHGPTVPSPTAGLISRKFKIPKDLIRDGLNEITFTTVCKREIDDYELKPSMRPDLGWLFGSALGWERIAFMDISREDDLPIENIKVELLPLYTENSTGNIDELVEVVIENMDEKNMLDVRLKVGDFAKEVKFAEIKHKFGDFRFQEKFPELTSRKKIWVEVELNPDMLRFSAYLTPARKWIVHLIPHVHLDIGYTDVQAKVIEVHNRNIDKVLDILKSKSEYSFSIDGSFNVETYLNSRDQRRKGELLEALKQGQISVNSIWALIFSGIPGLEDFFRSLYFAAELRAKHEVPIEYANLTDVPSYSASVPSILVNSGIHSFVGISNHTRGGNAESDALHLMSPVKWTGPDGSSVLAYFSDHYSQLRLVCGDPPTVAGVSQGLVTFLRRYEREDYLPNHFPLVGTHSDNEDLSNGYAEFVDRWNARYKWPRMKFSTMADYLASVRPLLDELPEIVGDGGSYWEDGMGTQAVATSVHRRTQSLLLGAEAISALAAANTPGATPNLKNLDESWRSVLIGEEHTWTWAHTTSHPHSRQTADQLDWKIGWIDRGFRLAVDETRRALSQLAELINAKSLPSVLVFNPSSWNRDLYFDFEIKDGNAITDQNFDFIEQYQVGKSTDGLKIVKARIPDVPPYGYKLLPVIEIDSALSEVEALKISKTNIINNDFYRVEIDEQTGTIKSLFHKKIGCQILSAESEFNLGDVLYVSGGGSAQGRGLGSEKTSIYDYPPDLPPVSLAVECARMSFVEAIRTPWSWLIHSHGEGDTLLNIRREIEIFDHTDEIQIRMSFTKVPNLAKESVYVAFPFNLTKPEVFYDRQIGWINPREDHLIGGCNEWFTVQNAVILQGRDFSVAWSSADAPLFTVSEVVRGSWATRFNADKGSIFSWVMNNYWMTNTPAQQGGNISLNYSFQPSQEKNFTLGGRLGRELRHQPLVSDLLHTDRGDMHSRPLNSSGSLWKLDLPENVSLTVLSSRNEGNITIRIQEISGKSVSFKLSNPIRATTFDTMWVASCLATEEIVEYCAISDKGEISVDLTPWAVKTYTYGTSKRI